MVDNSEIINIIENIKLPLSNEYYELDSADGYAYLGFARAKAGLEYKDFLKEINDRNYSLNAAWHGDKHTKYIYTIWTCIEFLREAGEENVIKELMNIVDSIGVYPDGSMRYCSHEIYYQVPNITSAAALLYAYNNEYEKCQKLVNILREREEDGNWKYIKLNEDFSIKAITVLEDAYHLGMIIYHLKKIEKVSGIITSDLVLKSVKALKDKNYTGDGQGKIGWGPPMIYLSFLDLEEKESKVFLEKTLKESIQHSNFRTRAIAAFALAEAVL